MLMLCCNRTAKLGHPMLCTDQHTSTTGLSPFPEPLLKVREPCLTWGIFLSTGHFSSGTPCRHSKEATNWIPNFSFISVQHRGSAPRQTAPIWCQSTVPGQQPKEQHSTTSEPCDSIQDLPGPFWEVLCTCCHHNFQLETRGSVLLQILQKVFRSGSQPKSPYVQATLQKL